MKLFAFALPGLFACLSLHAQQPNEAQPPSWVKEGNFVIYVLGQDSAGNQIELLVAPGCMVTGDPTGRRGDLEDFTKTAMDCRSHKQTPVTLNTVVVASTDSLGENTAPLEMQDAQPLVRNVDAYLLLRKSPTAENATPLRKMSLPVEVFFFTTSKGRGVVAYPANGLGNFRWKQDDEGNFSVHFVEGAEKWEKQLYWQL